MPKFFFQLAIGSLLKNRLANCIVRSYDPNPDMHKVPKNRKYVYPPKEGYIESHHLYQRIFSLPLHRRHRVPIHKPGRVIRFIAPSEVGKDWYPAHSCLYNCFCILVTESTLLRMRKNFSNWCIIAMWFGGS
jgi:hypothetical protein